MPQSWYKPAAWVQGSGWVCKRQRIRQKRPFEEKDLVRMVCKKYQDGVINPDTFYTALLDCGLSEVIPSLACQSARPTREIVLQILRQCVVKDQQGDFIFYLVYNELDRMEQQQLVRDMLTDHRALTAEEHQELCKALDVVLVILSVFGGIMTAITVLATLLSWLRGFPYTPAGWIAWIVGSITWLTGLEARLALVAGAAGFAAGALDNFRNLIGCVPNRAYEPAPTPPPPPPQMPDLLM